MTQTTAQKRAKRPTQADVAKLAGVSSAVVSSVLNNSRNSSIRVGIEARARVIDAMKTLGYSPNPVAQSLVGGRRNIIGVFTSDPTFPSDQRDFFYPFLYGIERGAEEVGFDLLLSTSGASDGEIRSIFRDGQNRLGIADGSILLGLKPNREELQSLTEQGYPFVVVGRREVEGVKLNWVGADYRLGAMEVVNHLSELGHRRITYLGEPHRREPQIDREEGYRAAMANIGLSGDDVIRPSGPNEVIEATSTFLERGVTAFVTETAELAMQVERHLADMGKSVPHHASVAVFGEPFMRSQTHDKWTRFSIPREEMGRCAVRMLLRLFDYASGQPLQDMLPCKLRVGATTQPPRQI
ncbi:MAG: LacI family DNA-binding transcriptional regulator [Pseudomonadota bacterium]